MGNRQITIDWILSVKQVDKGVWRMVKRFLHLDYSNLMLYFKALTAIVQV